MFDLTIVGVLVLAAEAGAATAAAQPAAAVETPAGSAANQPSLADVKGWLASLTSGEASVGDRAEIRQRLREVARGAPDEARTREALFGLAELIAGDPERNSQSITLLRAATTLYPDDPRTPGVLGVLGPELIEAGDLYGGHYALTRLFQQPDVVVDAELRVLAATNAMRVADTASALNWSAGVDPDALSPGLQERLLQIRLVAAQSVDRHGDALAALERLEQLPGDPRHLEEEALLAAAKTEAAVGRHADAVKRFQRFINIYPRSPHRAAAMLEQARLHARMQQPVAADRTFQWLLSTYPDAPEADSARVERIAVQGWPTVDARVLAYSKAAREATREPAATTACDRVLELLLAEGRPLEAMARLSGLASERNAMTALAARRSLSRGTEPAMRHLASRGDVVGLAAAGSIADSQRLAIPPAVGSVLRQARFDLGLLDATPQLQRARNAARLQRWEEVARTLGNGAGVAVEPTGSAIAERGRLLANGLWQTGRDADALATIEETLSSVDPQQRDARPLLVLRGDILYAAGDAEAACEDYASARRLARSTWVDRQLRECSIPSRTAEENAP